MRLNPSSTTLAVALFAGVVFAGVFLLRGHSRTERITDRRTMPIANETTALLDATPRVAAHSTARKEHTPPRDFKDVILRSGGCVMLYGSAEHDPAPGDPQFLALHAEEVHKLELLERSRSTRR